MCLAPPSTEGAASQPVRADFFVAVDGDNHWSGKLPSANAAKTDGPLATVSRARDMVRKLKAGGLAAPVTVMIRGGTHYLAEPIRFRPEDSGTKQCPIRYIAYPGEKPVLSAGRRITGWVSDDGKLFRASVPEVKAGKWDFRQLRVAGKRQIRARRPNYDPKDPIRGGWLFARQPDDWQGGFGTSVACIHNVGDYMEYEVDVPATGDYDYWAYVAMLNEPHTTADISGRTAIAINGGAAAPLNNMGDTGGWHKFQWRRAARVHLARGRHTLRWTNLTGGGINFDAFALTDDPDWQPKGPKPPPVQTGRHLLVVQAEAHVKAHGPQMQLDRGQYETKTEVFCGPGSLKPWPRSPEPEIHIFPRWGWVNGIVPVTGVDLQRSMLKLSKGWPEKVWLGNRFFVENVLEELDAPGEWYLDKATGTVHLLPEDPSFARGEVVAAVLDRVIEFRGDADPPRPVSYIALNGLTFTDTDYSPTMKSWYFPDDATIWLMGASHCRIAECTFRDVGGYAVAVKRGSADNEIVANTVVGAGQGGVFIDGGQLDNPHKSGPAALRPRSTLVSNNHIHHCGLVYKHVAGVYISHADRNTVSHNLIHDMPRYGISVKFECDSNVIEFNEVRRTNLETNDTGGIESYLNNKPSFIRHNLVADTIGLKAMPDGELRTPYFTWGIYLDGYTSNATVTGNIVYRAYRGGVVLSGSNNLIENNIFVGAKRYQVEFYNSRDEGKGNRFRRNIVYYADPDAAAVHLLRWREGFVESDHNLFFHAGGKLAAATSGAKRQPWEAWRAMGMDAHSVVADPLFVNAAEDDYRLRPGSPAEELGFAPIDVARIGLVSGPGGRR